ncbi:hypothetical protein [uncultured Cetobacterium sp.]|uniref:hypothetical protein n=1 Tax=uncultured Cetobacterium sp. TaxID=527638 RepID=UPI00261467F6|nr:hypothetical protein [uncultured Cetobacterium sp.]
MGKALSIFIPTFVVVLIVNQMFYGFCFKSYCLSAAFPKVVVLSILVSFFIFFVSDSSNKE